mgnify:CR=1 FL=1
MTKIKICGLTNERDAEIVNAVRPDFCGFVIGVPGSRRNVSVERAASLASKLCGVTAVGVFVNAETDFILHAVRLGAAKVIQLHGNESNEYIKFLQKETGVPVIKAFAVKSGDDIRQAENSLADMILLDSGAGSGKAFDWTYLRDVRRPYLLAGGLNPENLPRVLREIRPWGVDLSTGVEYDSAGRKAKGVSVQQQTGKELKKVMAAVAAVRNKH